MRRFLVAAALIAVGTFAPVAPASALVCGSATAFNPDDQVMSGFIRYSGQTDGSGCSGTIHSRIELWMKDGINGVPTMVDSDPFDPDGLWAEDWQCTVSGQYLFETRAFVDGASDGNSGVSGFVTRTC